jgi:hypothetical protein
MVIRLEAQPGNQELSDVKVILVLIVGRYVGLV